MTSRASLIGPDVLAKMSRVRRGLDPQQVAELVDEANRRIEGLQAQRDAALAENARVKNALRSWQTEQFEGAEPGQLQPRPLRYNDLPWP